ncbi:conserved exported hypothetical protein [metagenome]|uniref:Uncharacterized protein n=1 Tax=metagenome TaxID=256318 RepID=A0A2P2BZ54_9ZZZZ
MTGQVRRAVAHTATLLVLCLVTALLLPAAPASASSATSADDPVDPLEVSISGINPAVIPKRGPLKLSGTITNVSDDAWSLINVYSWISYQPLTSTDQLDLNAESDPYQQVGERIVEPETDLRIDRLEPGETASYTVSIPHDILTAYIVAPETAGVYRIGIQTLGTSVDGRPETAIGRAYSYVPLVPRDPATVRTAVILPIRGEVTYTHEGRVRDLPSWRRDLAPSGRLSNLLDFAATAPPGALSWLIDPAVLDAVQRIADGNPVRDLGPASDAAPEPSASPSADAGADGSAAERPLTIDDASRWATAWLTRLKTLTVGRQVLALPYGDVDMAAANTLNPQAGARATALSESVFDDLGISAEPTVAPPSGYLEPSSVAALDQDGTILASDAVLSDPDLRVDPESTSVAVNGHQVDLYDAAASSGGPGPTPRLTELALRQRLVSEATLRSMTSPTRPLVVALPNDWNPGASRSGFFARLDLPWLSMVAQQSLLDLDPPTVAADTLVYPERQADRELGPLNFDAAARLAQVGATLQNVLSDNTTVEREVTAQALTTTSYFMRDDPVEAIADAERARISIRGVLNQVHISAPEFVTLSGAAGPVRVDLRNDLAQTVTVQIEPISDPDITIRTPDAVKLEGGTSTSVRLRVRSTELGLHQVRLALVDVDGTQIGPSANLPIRSNQSGRIVWVIIGVGLALLFGAIILRLFRRFTGRGSHGDQG